MSRMLVGFDEDRKSRTEAEADMDFFSVCHTRAKKGQVRSFRSEAMLLSLKSSSELRELGHVNLIWMSP